MRNLLLASTVALALPLAAHAAPQISIGASSSGSVTFTGTGTGNISATQTAIIGQGSDTLGGAGTYTLSGFSARTFTSAGNGVWTAPAGTTETFNYVSGANNLTETLTIQALDDGSANPHFNGTDVVTAISGSAAFIATFGGVGRGSIWDYAVDSIAPNNLDALSLTTLTLAPTGISSGQVNPNALVPEPTTLALLGVGLLGLGVVGARRKR